jgi:hypothetical protein
MERPNLASLKAISIIHWAITFVPLIFGGVVLYINLTDPIGELSDENKILMYLPGGFMIIAFPASHVVYKNYLKDKIGGTIELRSKLGLFQTAHLIRIAMMEAVALFAAVTCLVTGNLLNLGIFCIALIMLVLVAPTPFKVAEALNLSQEERNQLTE